MDNHDIHDIDGLGVSQEDLDNLKSVGMDPNASLSDILKSILDPDAAPAEPAPEPAAAQPEPPAPVPEDTPDPEPMDQPDLDLDAFSDLDTYQDSGEYRTYNGNREYRSFDAALPDASPDEWYHYSDEDIELDDEDALYDDEEDEPIPQKRRHPVLSILAHMFLVLLTMLSIAYLVGVKSNIPVIAKARTMYIQTAMSTLNHKWLATALIPGDIIDEVMWQQYEYDNSMLGIESGENWGVDVAELPKLGNTVDSNVETDSPSETVPNNQETSIQYSSPEEELFYQVFWELDYESMSAYLEAHPEELDNGWYGIDINEAGLDDEGTSIKTIYGDQVLAVNASAGIVLIRIYLKSPLDETLGIQLPESRGILAMAKDTSRLSLCPASTLGTIGQTAGKICDANDGILAISGSAFDDPAGVGNGGQISGLAVCSGTTYGTRLGGVDKRIELRSDNKMYIVDSVSEVGSGTRDAAEFRPALIIDGKIVVDENCGWTGPNPRTVLGQSSKLETMMVVVEGRYTDSPGCSVVEVAELMQQYGCAQALNLDGGTSTMMYYEGEYIIRCSNANLPGGRTLPTAWVYK